MGLLLLVFILVARTLLGLDLPLAFIVVAHGFLSLGVLLVFIFVTRRLLNLDLLLAYDAVRFSEAQFLRRHLVVQHIDAVSGRQTNPQRLSALVHRLRLRGLIIDFPLAVLVQDLIVMLAHVILELLGAPVVRIGSGMHKLLEIAWLFAERARIAAGAQEDVTGVGFCTVREPESIPVPASVVPACVAGLLLPPARLSGKFPVRVIHLSQRTWWLGLMASARVADAFSAPFRLSGRSYVRVKSFLYAPRRVDSYERRDWLGCRTSW
eukprot:scaffold216_cov203-Pinguiococcus_pyrenoidosus.AAC.3